MIGLIIKGSLQAVLEDGTIVHLTNWSNNGYPEMYFESPKEYAKWIDERIKEKSMRVVI